MSVNFIIKCQTHLNLTPELTGEGVLCRDGLFFDGLLTVYSFMGGNRFGKSGILFCRAELKIQLVLQLSAVIHATHSKRMASVASEMMRWTERGISRDGTQTTVRAAVVVMVLLNIYTIWRRGRHIWSARGARVTCSENNVVKLFVRLELFLGSSTWRAGWPRTHGVEAGRLWHFLAHRIWVRPDAVRARRSGNLHEGFS